MVAWYLAAVLVVALWWLYGPSYAAPQPPADLASLPRIDGTLSAVEERRLVIRPLGAPAPDQRVLWIRYGDSHNLDRAHLRAHSALGIPTRIFYERAGGRDFAVWKQDAPVNDAPAG